MAHNIKHQAMLRDHEEKAQARRDRTHYGKHSDYKRDTEDFGFKPDFVPTGIHTMVFSKAPNKPLNLIAL